MSETAEGATVEPRVGWTRLAIGLVWGLLLYGLHKAAEKPVSWPATEPALNAGLTLAIAFAPFPLLASLGAMRSRALTLWTALAAAILGGLGVYDIWRDVGGPDWSGSQRIWPSFPLVPSAAAALFIAHHLIAGASAEGRPIARHATYFDTTWKHGVQLALSIGFVGVFWILLQLGAALFGLIGLKQPGEIIHKPWFFMVVNPMVFASAVHLTDVRAGVTRGFRTVGLTLLSWLMPVMGLIVAAFLLALPFTGLEPLWKIGRSTAILLAAAAALVILINAAYQDGTEETRPPAILRLAGRITALTLVPLIGIAAYGLMLRIGQHGLTPDRIIAAACVLVGAIYAVGYTVGAILPGGWMKPLEATNVLNAFVIIAVILALFTPLADPARISVDDQVARLRVGRTAPDKLDYQFLRFKAGRWGREALTQLAAEKTGPNADAIAKRAAAELALKYPYETPPVVKPPLTQRITPHPAGAKIPESFLNQDWKGEDPCPANTETCDAMLADVDGDGKDEVLVSAAGQYQIEIFKAGADGRWTRFATAGCVGVGDALSQGKVKAIAPAWKDLDVSGNRLRIQSAGACNATPTARP
jgi:hypothetical protein